MVASLHSHPRRPRHRKSQIGWNGQGWRSFSQANFLKNISYTNNVEKSKVQQPATSVTSLVHSEIPFAVFQPSYHWGHQLEIQGNLHSSCFHLGTTEVPCFRPSKRRVFFSVTVMIEIIAENPLVHVLFHISSVYVCIIYIYNSVIKLSPHLKQPQIFGNFEIAESPKNFCCTCARRLPPRWYSWKKRSTWRSQGQRHEKTVVNSMKCIDIAFTTLR